jgi:hypothetical protein
MPTETLPPTQKSASPPPPWQFRLWHLFALMTYVAVVVAVARKWGIETLPMTIGLGIAWLNYSGALWFLQRGKLQLAVLFIAWGLFLGSLFLPTHTQWAPEGWLAAWWVLYLPVEVVKQQSWEEIPKFLCWVPVIDAANLSQLLLPLTAIRLQMNRGKYLVAVDCVSMVAVWMFADQTAASGYILWCISFLLALTAMPLNRTTLLLMHLNLAGQFAFQWMVGNRF